jgi:amidase
MACEGGKSSQPLDNVDHRMTRRTFLGTGIAGGAALVTSGLGPLVGADADAAVPFAWNEATIPQLQAAMSSGSLTSRELTAGYISRIVSLNPLLRAVLELNPQATALAAGLDNERRRGSVRGPLHGIPVLLKDNIATNDTMQTTAGSLALVNSRVPGDAVLVERLRSAGAVILGKANLGEWANFRGFNPFGFYGWSARGGATRNPYLLDHTAFGSSSGSAVAVAANLCAVAVGTETNGSIISPSLYNMVVGMKPTLGLIAQTGIIPISLLQDTAGPVGRSVTDVAILLGVLQSPFGPVSGHVLPADYAPFLQRGALDGTRIGVDRRYFDEYDTHAFPGGEDALPFALEALDVMQGLGATLVDTDTGSFWDYAEAGFTALLFEFKVHITQYLATLGRTNMRSLADLIAFNVRHCPKEMPFYGQELFEMAEATSGLNDPAYLAARAHALQSARTGIDEAIEKNDLDAIVAPQLTNTFGPAVSGYPSLALPLGLTAAGKPAGLIMYSGFLREPTILALAYDLEQEMLARVEPQLSGSVVDPPEAGICAGLPGPFQPGQAHLPRGRIF